MIPALPAVTEQDIQPYSYDHTQILYHNRIIFVNRQINIKLHGKPRIV